MEKRSNRGIMKVYFDAGNTVMQNYEQEAIEKKVIILVEVKVCQKCGRELPTTSIAHRCPYCGGSLATKCIPKQRR